MQFERLYSLTFQLRTSNSYQRRLVLWLGRMKKCCLSTEGGTATSKKPTIISS